MCSNQRSPKVNKHSKIEVVCYSSWGEVRVLKVDMREVTMNVLYRIYGQSWLFKSVVKSRFGEIQTQTGLSQWRYVSTRFNPAEIITRGMTVKDIANSNFWWSRPDFLGTAEDK